MWLTRRCEGSLHTGTQPNHALKAKGEKLEDYKYYFDIHSYGAVPHGGYGLGTERLIKWICGLETIKDAIGFPRTMTRWKP